MESYLFYQGKVAVAIFALFIAYFLLFRKHKQFRFNRVYLFSSFIISFILPLITITVVKTEIPTLVITGDETLTQAQNYLTNQSQQPINYGLIITGIYVAGFITFLFRLAIGHLKALSIIHKSKPTYINNTRIYVSQLDIHPFTYFRKIVISNNTTTLSVISMIIDHEAVHAKEKHSIDALSAEFLVLFQWFNPFAWLLKDALKNNLEYIADDAVIRYHDQQTYQMTMVLQAKKLSSSPFLTALNGNNLKNRIIMMKKKSHSRWSSIKKLMVLPLMILLVSTLSGKEYQYETAGNKTAAIFDKIVTAQLTIPSTSVASPQTTLTKFTNRQELTDTLKVISIKNKNASPMIMINGKEIDLEKMKQIDPNIIDSIIIIKDSSAVISYGTKAKDGVIVIKTKKEFNDSEVTLSSTAKIVVSTLQSEIEKPTTNAKPLYIVDDKEIANFNDINPDVIESVTILKGSATAQYGEAGKNGVVFITTKSKHEDITSLETLHKYIARNIKYPMEAHKAGGQAKISLYAEISHEGKITNISETKPDAQVISVDEITVSSKSSKDVKKNSSKESEKILQQEAKRLIKTINKIDIPDLQGKWVQFRFNFILQ